MNILKYKFGFSVFLFFLINKKQPTLKSQNGKEQQSKFHCMDLQRSVLIYNFSHSLWLEGEYRAVFITRDLSQTENLM
jgi:hypothetical protein